MILTIDPGNESSAYVVWDELTQKIIAAEKLPNEELAAKLHTLKISCEGCYIEMIAAYGPVGASVLDTCVWIGIFAEIFGRSRVEYVFRKTVVTALTGSPRGNDSAVRAVLISRFGNGDTKKRQKGNILEGITADMWQALGIAVVISDRLQKRHWDGASSFVK